MSSRLEILFDSLAPANKPPVFCQGEGREAVRDQRAFPALLLNSSHWILHSWAPISTSTSRCTRCHWSQSLLWILWCASGWFLALPTVQWASSLLTEGSTTILAASRDSWLSTPPPVCPNLELKKVPFFAVLLENYGRKKSDFLCNTPSLGGTEGLRWKILRTHIYCLVFLPQPAVWLVLVPSLL